MGAIGFDNQKYLTTQSEQIKKRIHQFGGKLYLEFGGKLFDDYHASRVLPGFEPDSKIRMLQQLKDDVEIVIAICAAVTLAITSGTSAIENVVGTILSPIRAGVASIDRLAERYYNYMFRYETLEAENAEMEKQILAMQEDIRDAEQLQRENEWLKALLNLSDEHEDYKFLTSYIISWDSSDYKSAFTIGKGTNAGLEEGMCAVTENGQVVGLVTKVGTNWATVTTIMDSSLEISASVASSGYTGVVQGTFLEDGTEILRMNYLLTDAIVKNNDQVVTTGSTLYPRGLLLGYITNASLDETGVAKYATLEPSCDLSKLEQIAIITEYNVQ